MIGLIGHRGYIGKYIASHLQERMMPWFKVDRVHTAQVGFLQEHLVNNGAKFVINAAGYTGDPNVDACEEDRWRCLYGNAVLPGIVAEACAGIQIPMGHISSGCIFNGYKKDYNETDKPNFDFKDGNGSYYTGCKSLGEDMLHDYPMIYIWRIRMPFNHIDNPRNYLSKLLTYKKLVNALNSLSHIEECVQAMVDCWWHNYPYGIYNLVNRGYVDTKWITSQMQAIIAPNQKFKFFDNLDQFHQTVRAPRSNCVLSNKKAIDAGLKLSDVHSTIISCLKKWK